MVLYRGITLYSLFQNSIKPITRTIFGIISGRRPSPSISFFAFLAFWIDTTISVPNALAIVADNAANPRLVAIARIPFEPFKKISP